MPQITKEEYAMDKHRIIVLPLHLLVKKQLAKRNACAPFFINTDGTPALPRR